MPDRMRREVLEWRQTQHRPWHSPPHWNADGTSRYLFTAACFEHQPIIGNSIPRLVEFENTLRAVIEENCEELHAWVILPNHYHFLATTRDAVITLRALGKMHGRTSFQWNGEEHQRGRKIWCNSAETAMKSERHFWATMNYIHHNPVKHGWANSWQEWPFSSAAAFLESSGPEKANPSSRTGGRGGAGTRYFRTSS